MTFTQIDPRTKIPAERIVGYRAMANAIITMFERSDFYDPAGLDMFQERVERLIPVRPGFLQLASDFLAKQGTIKLGKNKRGETIMADSNEIFEFRSYILNHARKMRLHGVNHARGMEEPEGREEHVAELVEGTQYLFKYRSVDLEVGVKFAVTASGFKREFDSEGNEIPGSRKTWTTKDGV